jgi:hypothetical protein
MKLKNTTPAARNTPAHPDDRETRNGLSGVALVEVVTLMGIDMSGEWMVSGIVPEGKGTPPGRKMTGNGTETRSDGTADVSVSCGKGGNVNGIQWWGRTK